jgi:hypothetical protein
MNSSEPNIAQDQSPKVLTDESVDWAKETHKEFGDRLVKSIIEGMEGARRDGDLIQGKRRRRINWLYI